MHVNTREKKAKRSKTVSLKPHACTKGSESFSTERYRRSHSLMHSEEKVRECSFCDHEAKKTYGTKVHQKTYFESVTPRLRISCYRDVIALGKSLIGSLARSHRSLVHLLRTARYTCLRSLVRSLVRSKSAERNERRGANSSRALSRFRK